MIQSVKGGELPSKGQLSWFLSARVGGMSLILLGAISHHFSGGLSQTGPFLKLLYVLVALSYGQALASAICLRKEIHLKHLASFQIAWDLLLASVLVGATGSFNSLFTFVYLLVIISASFFLGKRSTMIIAAIAAGLFVLIVLLHQGYNQSLVYPHKYILPILVHSVAFFLTAFLSGSLAERWRHSLVAYERKSVDFNKLEELNRVILANIGSGLMLVGVDGKIKTFNRAATRITGNPFEQVYGKNATIFFPDLKLTTDEGDDIDRSEMVLTLDSNNVRVVGYATTQIQHSDGTQVGTLVTFQDLTKFKDLEDRLQRSDRLAAIGRMSRGIAHEIRNPLASISGSVQMLLEKEDISTQGRRLMNIIEREADRLSDLLGDFLDYAKPAVLSKEPIDVTMLLDEVIELVEADASRHGIQLHKKFSRPFLTEIDRTQFKQAIWNLLINAKEAISAKGDIVVSTFDHGEIRVEDSGSGIEEKDLPHIFDPFFTTKDRGSGLGLATVHSIIEAHNGSIRVGKGDMGGACFVIHLPVLEAINPISETVEATHER